MLQLSKSLLNQPVMSIRTSSQIALATQPIINPHNLKILGWWCSDGQVLLFDQVREIMTNGLAVNDEDALSAPGDLVRFKDVLSIQFELLDKPVRTKRHKLGKVGDYSYNEGLYVQKLYVSSPLHKVFASDDTLIIDREQIIEVTDKYILVRDTEVKVGSEEFSGAPAGA